MSLFKRLCCMESKKLNIGLFVDSWFPMVDGVINVVDNYAKRLCKIANVTVFAPKARGEYDASGVPYNLVQCKSAKVWLLDYDLPMPRWDSNFKKALKHANLDIIHVHSPFSIGKSAVKYGKKHNIPIISTMHSQFEQDFLRATKSKLLTKICLKAIMSVFNKSDLCLTMNSACVKLLMRYGCKTKIEILPNATDLVPFDNPTEIRVQTRQKYNVPAHYRMFVNVGRLDTIKNIDFVLDVCKILKDEGFLFKQLIVGGGKDEQKFKDKVHRLGLDDDVIFTGKIMDKAELSKIYQASDLHVFPSFYDTDGIVRIEASTFGVPTIFVEGSIASSTVTDNVNGFVGKNDTQAFANKIIDIFKDNEHYQQVRLNCHRDLYITWDSLMDRLLGVYTSVLQEKNECKKI